MASEPRTIKGPCFDCDDGDPPCGCGCRFVLPQFACPCHGSVRGTATNPKTRPETRPNVPPRMIAAAEDVLSSAYSTEEVGLPYSCRWWRPGRYRPARCCIR